MTKNEDIQQLAKKFESIIESRNDAEYRINQKNWTKLLTVLDYLDTEAKKLGGRLEPVNLQPREQHGYAEAIFDVFDVSGDGVKALSAALQLVDVFSIEPLESGQICIGININNVYEKIN